MTDSRQAELIALGERVLLRNYGRSPVVLTHGEGTRVYDADGKAYVDFVGGIAVDVLGHGHPALVRAVQAQAASLIHVSNLYWIEPQIRLADLLVRHSFADRAFFCNSGAEANEAAIKLARRFAYTAGRPERCHVVSAVGGFHGRTLGALAATGQPKYHEGFGPLPEGFRHVPFGDVSALEAAVDDRVCAVLLEPIQAEGGVHVPPDGYLSAARRLCDERGALLIFDEIQTGMGRTGRLWAHEHWGVAPDVMTLAKGLAGGVPIGAMLVTERVAGALGPGSHGTTFGGNPLATAAGVAVLRTLLDEGVVERAAAVGRHFLEALRGLAARRPRAVRDVRGKGLLIGLELAEGLAAADIVKRAMADGFLVASAGPQVVRFVPPLVIAQEDVDRLVAALDRYLGDRA
ncbi:MAG TPA: acetylornithine transaminase [Thermodesulfobacteriota bacterium]